MSEIHRRTMLKTSLAGALGLLLGLPPGRVKSELYVAGFDGDRLVLPPKPFRAVPGVEDVGSDEEFSATWEITQRRRLNLTHALVTDADGRPRLDGAGRQVVMKMTAGAKAMLPLH